jgi:hypothetical protein
MPGNLKVKNHVFLGKFCTTAKHSARELGRFMPATTTDYKPKPNGAQIAGENQASGTELGCVRRAYSCTAPQLAQRKELNLRPPSFNSCALRHSRERWKAIPESWLESGPES